MADFPHIPMKTKILYFDPEEIATNELTKDLERVNTKFFKEIEAIKKKHNIKNIMAGAMWSKVVHYTLNGKFDMFSDVTRIAYDDGKEIKFIDL